MLRQQKAGKHITILKKTEKVVRVTCCLSACCAAANLLYDFRNVSTIIVLRNVLNPYLEWYQHVQLSVCQNTVQSVHALRNARRLASKY